MLCFFIDFLNLVSVVVPPVSILPLLILCVNLCAKQLHFPQITALIAVSMAVIFLFIWKIQTPNRAFSCHYPEVAVSSLASSMPNDLRLHYAEMVDLFSKSWIALLTMFSALLRKLTLNPAAKYWGDPVFPQKN